MGAVFNFQTRPNQDDDVRTLWKSIIEIMDALEMFTITVMPPQAGSVKPSEGDVEIDITCLTLAQAALNGLNIGGSQPSQGGDNVLGGQGDGSTTN